MRWRIILLAGCALAAAGCTKKPAATGLDAADGNLANGAVTAESRDAKALREAIRVDPARAGRHAAPAVGAPTTMAATAFIARRSSWDRGPTATERCAFSAMSISGPRPSSTAM